MGQQPSRADDPTGQPDGKPRTSNSIRVPRLSKHLSLRKHQGRAELEGDPNPTKIYELEGSAPRPEMAQKARSAFIPTYLHAEDLDLLQSKAVGTTSHQPDDAMNPPRQEPTAAVTLQAGRVVEPSTRRTRRSSGYFAGAPPNPSLQATQWRGFTTPGLEAASPRQHGIARTASETYVRRQAPPLISSPPARRAGPDAGRGAQKRTTGVEHTTVCRAQLSRQITSISHLLREMYSLDLKIFGAQNTRVEEQGDRNDMIDRAERLYQVVRDALDQLAGEQKESWTHEEQEILRRIRETAEWHRPRRHELAVH